MSEKIHVFEQAGLGAEPYRFLGITQETYQACPGAPIQPGTCCDYCGTGIVITCWFFSSDGRRFKVGSDCYHKASNSNKKKDRRDPVIQALARLEREKRQAHAAAQKTAARERLQSDQALCEKLAAQPHPLDYRAAKGETLLDWTIWMLDHAGNASCAKVWKLLQKN